jgi:phosphatidate cytidylyltransferase
MAMGDVAAKVVDGDIAVWIGMALIAAITGVFGDLVESLFKRSVDVKDSGNILPGHGGWLDRFDALILSIPFVFVYLVLCIN